jgi:hypothetical protein
VALCGTQDQQSLLSVEISVERFASNGIPYVLPVCCASYTWIRTRVQPCCPALVATSPFDACVRSKANKCPGSFVFGLCHVYT